MNAEQRRKKILKILKESSNPITGSELSKALGVSRQVIVTDVALLRAKGNNILSTPRGYITVDKIGDKKYTETIAVKHGHFDIKSELETIINYGGKIIDVTVEHPLYGELKGILMINSPNELEQFINALNDTKAKPLLVLTEGVHLHTIQADSEDIIKRIKETLKQKGFLIDE